LRRIWRIRAALPVLGVLVALAAGPAPAAGFAPYTTPELTVGSTKGTEATLDGVLDPEASSSGEPGEYRFLYKAGGECKGGSETSPGAYGGGTGEELLSGLTPGSEYTACLQLTNAAKTEQVISAPVTFTTLATPTPSAEFTANVENTSLTLTATIDPGVGETSYHFEYDRTPYTGPATHGTSVAGTPASPLPAGTSPVSISARLEGLAPDTRYYFRVVASGSAGTVEGSGDTFTTPAPVSTVAESCGNEQFRTGYSAGLPECRAYELVSPPGTSPQIMLGEGSEGANNDMSRSADIAGEVEGAMVSASGERLAFTSKYPPPGSSWDAQFFLASRGSEKWSTIGLVPPQTPEYGVVCVNAFVGAYSPELTSWILGDGYGQLGSGDPDEECGRDDPSLVENEPLGFQNLFLREGPTAPYQLIDVTPSGVQSRDAWFQAASSGLNHVVFDEDAALTPGAPVGDDLYMWSGGSVRLVSVLPDGTAAKGTIANEAQKEEGFLRLGAETFTHAISTDGSRVFFDANGNLYMRERPYSEQSALRNVTECTEADKACTLQIDAGESRCVAENECSSGAGTFQWASADGSRVFFTDANRLTSASTAVASKPDLYEYDFAAPEGERLTDLTADAGEPADVQGVSGASEDGSYVYFVADGKLTAAANSHGDAAVPGAPNLYVVHEASLAFVATLDPTHDNQDWSLGTLTARVSPSGRFVAFDSQLSLTGYDNTPVEPADCKEGRAPRPCTEIFLYDAVAQTLNCVSCEPRGGSPTAPASINEPNNAKIDRSGLEPNPIPGYLQHNVSDEGQVFFDTAEPLSPHATNAQPNVYEYRNGEVQLLSTATSNVGAYFYEASTSGDDVFLTSSQPLAPGAQGSEYSIYDARVGGGLSAPEPATVCSEEDCRGAFTATPLLAAPSSETFVGPGNPVTLTPAPAGGPKQQQKKPGKKKKKRRHKRKGKGKDALGRTPAVHGSLRGVR